MESVGSAIQDRLEEGRVSETVDDERKPDVARLEHLGVFFRAFATSHWCLNRVQQTRLQHTRVFTLQYTLQ